MARALAIGLATLLATVVVACEGEDETPTTTPDLTELEPCGGDKGARPRAPVSRTVDDAEERADRHPRATVEPRAKLLPAPRIHPDLASLAALPMTNEQGPATRVEVALRKAQGLRDPKAGTPEDDDQSSEPRPVDPRAGLPHDGDDLLNSRGSAG